MLRAREIILRGQRANDSVIALVDLCCWAIVCVCITFTLNSNQINKKLNWLTFFLFAFAPRSTHTHFDASFCLHSFLFFSCLFFYFVERHLKHTHLVYDWRGLPIKYQLTHRIHTYRGNCMVTEFGSPRFSFHASVAPPNSYISIYKLRGDLNECLCRLCTAQTHTNTFYSETSSMAMTMMMEDADVLHTVRTSVSNEIINSRRRFIKS